LPNADWRLVFGSNAGSLILPSKITRKDCRSARQLNEDQIVNRQLEIGSYLPPWLAIAATTKTTAIATASAVATATTAETATSAAATILARFSFVDSQAATVDFLAIELSDGGFAFLFSRHFHEPKAARTTCVPVFDYAGRLDRARLREKLL